MEAPNPEDEYDLIIRRLAKALSHTFSKATVAIDEGDRHLATRPFEKFEVFFMLPEACSVLDARDIDSTLVFEMLIFQAVRAIEERYRQILPNLHAPIRGLGVHKDTSWRFGDEVPEAEAMLGTAENEGDIPACWTLWVRYVLPIDQKITRCKSAPIVLPPKLPERPGIRWVLTEDGHIREELIEREDPATPLHQWRSEKPRFEELDGYELDEEEPDRDWEDI
jgi:hypothetical protein